jgi:hypothetical protein
LQVKLKAALGAALAQNGPVGAIDVCATVAPALARELSIDGLTVARTGPRVRNPNNTTPAWLATTMTRWTTEVAAARSPFSATLDDGRFVYAAPISMQPLCATCHGAAVADDVKAAIAARYPADAATGFAEGDLRGAVWVEFNSWAPRQRVQPVDESGAGAPDVRPTKL